MAAGEQAHGHTVEFIAAKAAVRLREIGRDSIDGKW